MVCTGERGGRLFCSGDANSNWWLEHGLDGIVSGLLGALIGGIATALAVYLTLRHERWSSRRQPLEEAVTDLLRISGRGMALVEGTAPRWAIEYGAEFFSALMLAVSRSDGLAPNLSARLDDIAGEWLDTLRREEEEEQSGEEHEYSSLNLPGRQVVIFTAGQVAVNWLSDPADDISAGS